MNDMQAKAVMVAIIASPYAFERNADGKACDVRALAENAGRVVDELWDRMVGGEDRYLNKCLVARDKEMGNGSHERI